MNQKRGRKKKSLAEYTRMALWYNEIKSRCRWSDAKLDREFAWKIEGEDKAADRPRYFEWIRKKSRMPRGNHKWRNMEEIVSAVEKNPLFKGTKTIYDSPLWDLLEDRNANLRSTRKIVNRCLENAGLVRLEGMASDILDFSVIAATIKIEHEPLEVPKETRYFALLDSCFEEIPEHIERIALLGALYREAYLACSLEIAFSLSKRFHDSVFEFCSQRWPHETIPDLFDRIVNGVLLWEMTGEDVADIYEDGPFNTVNKYIISDKNRLATGAILTSEKWTRQRREIFGK